MTVVYGLPAVCVCFGRPYWVGQKQQIFLNILPADARLTPEHAH